MVLLIFMVMSIIGAIWHGIGVKDYHACWIGRDMNFGWSLNAWVWSYKRNEDLFENWIMILSNWPHIACILMIYNVFPYFWYLNSSFKAFEYRIWASRTVLENPKFMKSTRAGELPLEREILVPRTFADMDVRSSEDIHARMGRHVAWLSARAPKFTLERNNKATCI